MGRHTSFYQEESLCSVDHVAHHFQARPHFAPIVVQLLPIISRVNRDSNLPAHHNINLSIRRYLLTTRPRRRLPHNPVSHLAFMGHHPMVCHKSKPMALPHQILTARQYPLVRTPLLHPRQLHMGANTHRLLAHLYHPINHLAVRAPKLA